MFSQHCIKIRIHPRVLEDIQRATVNLREDGKVVNFDNSGITTANVVEGMMKVGFKIMKKSRPLALGLIGGILIMLLGITGCSDVPYTGQVITAESVDQYLDSIQTDTVCLDDGFDSVCIKLMLNEAEDDEASVDYTPIVHVHPTSLNYVFYYEDRPILRARRGMDTSELIEELADNGRVQLPSDINNIGATGAQNNFDGWVIEIYHTDTFLEINRPFTLGNSGLDIRAVEGKRILPNNRRDLVVNNFMQADGLNGSSGVQFSVETDAPNITIQVGGLVAGHTAKFHISANGVDSDSETNILQLQPVR